MFLISLVLAALGLGIILQQAMRDVHYSMSAVFAGCVIFVTAIPFFIAGLFSKKRIHRDDHFSLP